MDINVIRNILSEKYNCDLITILNYTSKNFAKTLDKSNEIPYYRYFLVRNNNTVDEILDDLILAYFRENYELSEDVEY